MADMDLGSLFVHLKATNGEALKAIKEYEDNMKKASKTTKTAAEEIREAFAVINKSASIASGGIGMAFEGLKMGIHAVSGAAGVFFTPLKMLIDGFVSVETVIKAAGLTCVETAGKFDFLYKKLQVTMGAEKAAKVWKESIDVAGFFDVEEIMNARYMLESVGVKGTEALKTVSDAAIMLDEDIQSVARSIMRMSSGTLRGIRLMGIDFEIMGKTYWFRYWNKGIQYVKSAVGVAEAQAAILKILSEKYGTATDAVGKTTEGLHKTFKTIMSELREEVGRGMMPLVNAGLEDVIAFMKGSMGAGKTVGEKMGDQMVQVRAYIVAGFREALAIAERIGEVLKQEGGLGKVLQEAFEFGADLFAKGFLLAVKASISIWKFIGTVLGSAIMEVLYDSGIPLMKGAGERKHAKDVTNALGNLNEEDLKKVMAYYKISDTITVPNNPAITQGMPGGVGVPGAAGIGQTIKITSAAGMRDLIGQQFKGLTQEQIEKKMQEVSRITGKDAIYDPYAGLNEGLKEIEKDFRQFTSDFGNLLGEATQKFTDRIVKNTVDQNIIQGIENSQNPFAPGFGNLPKLPVGPLAPPKHSNALDVKNTFLGFLQEEQAKGQKLLDDARAEQKKIEEQQNKPPTPPPVVIPKEFIHLNELGKKPVPGAFPSTTVQAMMEMTREAQVEVQTAMMTPEQKEHLEKKSKFQKLLSENFLGGGTLEESMAEIEQMKAIALANQMADFLDPFSPNFGKTPSGPPEATPEQQSLQWKVDQFKVLNDEYDKFLIKVEEEKNANEILKNARKDLVNITEKAMSPYEKWKKDTDDLAKSYETIYGADWMENPELAGEYNDIVDGLTKKYKASTDKYKVGSAASFDTRYVSAESISGKDVQSQQLEVLKRIANNTAPVY